MDAGMMGRSSMAKMETQPLPVGKTRYHSIIRDLIVRHDIQQEVHSIPAEVQGVPPSVLPFC